MMSLTRAGGLALLAMALGLGGPARAQESLDAGKSGAQLYASNCAMCHKSPQALNKGALFGMSNFLREHYTASRETAAAIAAYVEAQGRPAAAPAKKPPAKRTAAKPGDKPGDTKPKEKKPAQVEAKPAEAKPADAKPPEPKPELAPIMKPEEPKKKPD